MPKGRIGISGPGVFARVYPPILGDEPTSDEQRKLVAVFEIRSAAISELEKRRPDGDVEIDFTILWAYILRALGTYLGQAALGLPPTLADQDRVLARIDKAAAILEKEIADANFHVRVILQRAMSRRGADLTILRKQLDLMIDQMQLTDEVRQPKGRPDPYLEDLIVDLIEVWTLATGKLPGKTGENHYKGVRTSPFYRWCNMIAVPGIGKTLPRDLIDMLIADHKSDG